MLVGESFPKAENCYNAIALLGFNVTKLTNATASEKDAPHGCVLVRNADGSGEALYNTGGNTSSDAAGCASSIVKVAQSGSPSTKVLYCTSFLCVRACECLGVHTSVLVCMRSSTDPLYFPACRAVSEHCCNSVPTLYASPSLPLPLPLFIHPLLGPM